MATAHPKPWPTPGLVECPKAAAQACLLSSPPETSSGCKCNSIQPLHLWATTKVARKNGGPGRVHQERMPLPVGLWDDQKC